MKKHKFIRSTLRCIKLSVCVQFNTIKNLRVSLLFRNSCQTNKYLNQLAYFCWFSIFISIQILTWGPKYNAFQWYKKVINENICSNFISKWQVLRYSSNQNVLMSLVPIHEVVLKLFFSLTISSMEAFVSEIFFLAWLSSPLSLSLSDSILASHTNSLGSVGSQWWEIGYLPAISLAAWFLPLNEMLFLNSCFLKRTKFYILMAYMYLWF